MSFKSISLPCWQQQQQRQQPKASLTLRVVQAEDRECGGRLGGGKLQFALGQLSKHLSGIFFHQHLFFHVSLLFTLIWLYLNCSFELYSNSYFFFIRGFEDVLFSGCMFLCLPTPQPQLVCVVIMEKKKLMGQSTHVWIVSAAYLSLCILCII